MRILKHPLFLLSLALYGLNQYLKASGILIPGVHFWMNDLLCIPVVLTLVLAFQRAVTFRNPNYRFTPWHVGVAVFQFSLLFEVIFPAFSTRTTADPLDVIAYAAGGVLFYFLINPPAPKSVQASL